MMRWAIRSLLLPLASVVVVCLAGSLAPWPANGDDAAKIAAIKYRAALQKRP